MPSLICLQPIKRRFIVLVFLCFSLMPNMLVADNLKVAEYQIKAAFLYNFAKFIIWPESVFSADDSSFHICIAGSGGLAEKIKELLDAERLGKRALEIIPVDLESMEKGCQILFISTDNRRQIITALSKIKLLPILSVSDNEKFIQDGGMIEFYREGKKLRFAIAPRNIQKANLKPDANLFRVGKVIEVEDNGGGEG